MIITERGLNKSLVPVRRMKGKNIQFPFTWTVEEDGKQFECSLSDYWTTANFMATDVIANCYASLNSDKIQKKEPVFTNFTVLEYVDPKPIQFTTEDFRRLTGQKNLYRKEITELVIETSKIELSIVYPILYFEDIKKGRNKVNQ